MLIQDEEVLWKKNWRDAGNASRVGHGETIVYQVGIEQMSASLFFSAIKASMSARVFSFMGVLMRLGVAVPESVLKVSPKKPVGRVVFCWRLRAAARVRGQGPWDLFDCCTGVVALVVAAVEAQDATLDWRAAFWRSS